MNTNWIFVNKKMRAFILENFLYGEDGGQLNDEDSFLDKGIIDSTGVLELVQFLEESFQIEVTDEEMVPENLDSIVRLTHFVCSKDAEPGVIQ
jgi:acyl carrier protein